jgi:hypothetical protein
VRTVDQTGGGLPRCLYDGDLSGLGRYSSNGNEWEENFDVVALACKGWNMRDLLPGAAKDQ